MSAPPYPPGEGLKWEPLFDGTITAEEMDVLVEQLVRDTMEEATERLRDFIHDEFPDAPTNRVEAKIAELIARVEPMIRAKTREQLELGLKRLRH